MPRLTPPPDPNPRAPKLKLPAGSVDCHLHMFGPVARYPFASDAQYISEDATAETYFALQDRLGLAKAVLVSGGGYGESYTHLADMLAKYPQRLRGVVRLPAKFTRDALAKLDRLGVRAARWFGGPGRIALERKSVEMILEFGWHIQYYPAEDGLIDVADHLLSFDTIIVLDHFAHNTTRGGMDSPGNRALLAMLDTGRVWVKMSAPMRIAKEEPPYPSVTPIARALVKHAPERLLWGSDWPHTHLWDATMPNDGALVDLIGEWIPDAATRRRILVENPAALYGFD